MKKFFISMITAITAATAGGMYPEAFTVREIRGDVVTLETSTGYTYTIRWADDYEPGDVVAGIVFNSFSGGIADDIVVKIKYTGIE